MADPVIIDSRESNWISRVTNDGVSNLTGELTTSESWESYSKNSGGVLQYPANLGYDPELKNYVLFDIYEVVGQSVSSTQNPVQSQDGFTIKVDDEEVSLQQAAREGAETTFSESPLAGKNNGQVLTAVGDAAEEGISVFQGGDPTRIAEARRGGLQSFNAASLGFVPSPRRLNVSVALPMPAQLNTNYGFEYEDVDYTGLMNLISAKNALQNMARDGKEVDAQTKELLRKVVSIPSGVIDSLSNIFGSDNVNLTDAANMRRGQAPNKFKEQTFKGVTRRSFSFEWELSPRSEEDATRIYSIIYTFKKYAHPTRSEGGMYLNYPAQFKIGFFTGTALNGLLFRIALCGCTKCEVTYGGSDLTFFRGNSSGAPANTVKLSLEFTELELLTQERIQQGY